MTLGFSHNDFWISETERKKLQRTLPYNFNLLISKSRFDLISKHLSFAMNSSPTYRDKFQRLRKIIDKQNQNMVEVLDYSQILHYNKSISLQLNRQTCPGWIFVLRNPQSMSNEYHSMCCGLSSIMFMINLVKERDKLKEVPLLDSQKNSSTISLLLRMY